MVLPASTTARFLGDACYSSTIARSPYLWPRGEYVPYAVVDLGPTTEAVLALLLLLRSLIDGKLELSLVHGRQ